jgi:hypothetical protein
LTVLSSGIAVKLGIEQISEAVSEEVVKPFQELGSEQDEKLKNMVGVLDKVNVSNVSFAPSSWSGKAKVIGTITNNSVKSIKGIHITTSLRRSNKLINVKDSWLTKIKVLTPGASADFNFMMEIEEGQNTDDLSMSVKVVDLGVLE